MREQLNDNPVVQVSYPLQVGKTWTGSAHRDCPSKPSSNFDLSYARAVEAYERITVPEGSHDALRIRSELSYSNLGYDPEGGYTVTTTCWWAASTCPTPGLAGATTTAPLRWATPGLPVIRRATQRS